MKDEIDLKIFDNEKIELADLIDLVPSYYIDYCMSVIISRALPDVRDGLKPVHRRILYAMNDLKLNNEGAYKKCARIVGEVLGKYHPHGDSSVYDALVRLAQDFKMRYVLVEGHGNFGSIDGDSPASMRYTEAKQSVIVNTMLTDLKEDTVDFVPNFDGDEVEPAVLPARYPNLLVNGADGIAVGFSTSIPTHNLGEAIDQTIYQIDHPDCTVADLIEIMKAPDFSTGGIIVNPQDMQMMYETGRGAITIRGTCHIENETDIVFTEIPYGVNKEKLMIELVKLYKGYNKIEMNGKKKETVHVDAKIPSIIDIADRSHATTGMAITITVDSPTNIKPTLALLFKNSKLQNNFNAIFTAVNNGKLLEEMSLKDINTYYINHQIEVLTRRSQFRLNKALKRQHILEGLITALKDIDYTIKLIRGSSTKQEARLTLMEKLIIDELQANAILSVELSRLTSMEIDSFYKELYDINENVNYLNSMLTDKSVLLSKLKDELLEIKDKYSDDRKTAILYDDIYSNMDVDEIEIKDYTCRIVYTGTYIKKHLQQSNKHKIKDGETIIDDMIVNNKDTLLIFTTKGNRYKIRVNDLAEYKPASFGDYIYSVIKDMTKDETIFKIVSLNANEAKGYLYGVYANGNIVKMDVNKAKLLSSKKKLSNCFDDKSELLDIAYSEQDIDILLISSDGKGTIVNSSKVNSVANRHSGGVGGINLSENQKCICGYIDINKDYHLRLTDSTNAKKECLLYDIAPTGKPNEERTLYTYLKGKGNRNRAGNMIWNMRNYVDNTLIKAEVVK